MCLLQIVAGVLCKHVNIAKGWRDRLFVLCDDQLHYYKVRVCKPVQASVPRVRSCE